MSMRQFVCCILLFVLGTAAGMLLPRSCINTDHRGEVETRTDTLYVRDTIVERSPVFDAEITVPDMVVVIEDSIIVKDDSLLVLPMQQRHYKGENYEAWVSGYRPQLDSVWVFPETRYITKEVKVQRKPTRWGIGIQAGYGVGVNSGQVTAFPYIGVGISYNIVRW